MQNQVDIETVQPVARVFDLEHQPGYRAQRLTTGALVLSDLLFALVIWEVLVGFTSLWADMGAHGAMLVSVAPSLAVWIGLRILLGLYPGYGLDVTEELRRQTYATLAALAISVILVIVSEFGGTLTSVLLVANFLLLLLLAPMVRYAVKRAMLGVKAWGKPVAVFGSRGSGMALTEVLQREWQLGLRPTITTDSNAIPAGEALNGSCSEKRADYESPFVNIQESFLLDAISLARKKRVDTVVFAMPHTRREDLARLVDLASLNFRHVVVTPNLGGITNSMVTARDFAGHLGVEIRHNLLDPWSRRIKRVLDLFATVLGGLLISPILVTIAVLIKLDSPGPVFYGSLRRGATGRQFRCWKFRTMHRDAERLLEQYLRSDPALRLEWKRNYKLRHDPRITRVGHFLRKTSLDELPQLWNVLCGEMSLVGPRPILEEELRDYGEKLETYQRVIPGITGPWQVNGRSEVSYEDRITMNSHYVCNWSVWLDLVILARTVWSVVLRRGAY